MEKKENVFNQLGMLADLMRNAGKLRESFQSLGQLEVEGHSGGGAVTVKVSGRFEVVSVRIDPKLVSDGDPELLEDLVAAAVNAALAKAQMPRPSRWPRRPAAFRSTFFPTWAASPILATGVLDHGGLRLCGGRRSPDRRPGTLARHRSRVGREARDHLLRCATDEALELSESIRAAKQQIRHCQVCFHLTEAEQPLYAICRDPRRDQATVCVVEQSRDLMALEGRNVPGRLPRAFGPPVTVIRPGADQLTVDALVTRVHSGSIRELIMATNPNLEGDGTSLLIASRLGDAGIRITRLSRAGFRQHARIRQSRNARRCLCRPPTFLIPFQDCPSCHRSLCGIIFA